MDKTLFVMHLENMVIITKGDEYEKLMRNV